MLAQIQSKFLAFSTTQYMVVVSGVIFIFLLNACSSDTPGPQLSGLTMGTSYSVQWTELPAHIEVSQLQTQIESRLEEINDLMSTYLPHSQLSGFNRSRETGWHAVESELAELTSIALSISEQSRGAFDVTIGPLVNLWGFGPDEIEFSFPTQTLCRWNIQTD